MARACARSVGASAANGLRPRVRPSSSCGRSKARMVPWARRRASWRRRRRRRRSSPATRNRRWWRSAMPTASFCWYGSRMAPRSWRAKERAHRSRGSPGTRPARRSPSALRPARPASSISDDRCCRRVKRLFLLWRGHALRRRARALRAERIVGQPVPCLGAAEQRDAEIAAHFELAAVGTEAHQRAIDRAVARVHDRPVFIGIAVAPHPLDQRQAQHRRALLRAFAPVADPILVFTGLEEDFDEIAHVNAVALRDLEPALGLAGVIVDLLP